MSAKAKVVYSAAAFGLIGFFAYVFIEHLPGKPNPIIAKQPDVAMATMYTDLTLQQQPVEMKIENGKIIIPLSKLLEKKIVEFEYQAPTMKVPLLAFITNDGKLVTCIRMCEPCNSRTFRIIGDKLACGNCETEWKLNNLEGIQGSCQKYPPQPIPSIIIGSEIQIDEKTVRDWKMRI